MTRWPPSTRAARAGVRGERRDRGGEPAVERGRLVLGRRDRVDDRAKGDRGRKAAVGGWTMPHGTP